MTRKDTWMPGIDKVSLTPEKNTFLHTVVNYNKNVMEHN